MKTLVRDQGRVCKPTNDIHKLECHLSQECAQDFMWLELGQIFSDDLYSSSSAIDGVAIAKLVLAMPNQCCRTAQQPSMTVHKLATSLKILEVPQNFD